MADNLDREALRDLVESVGWRYFLRIVMADTRQRRRSLLTSTQLTMEERCETIGRLQGVYSLLREVYLKSGKAVPDDIESYFLGEASGP